MLIQVSTKDSEKDQQLLQGRNKQPTLAIIKKNTTEFYNNWKKYLELQVKNMGKNVYMDWHTDLFRIYSKKCIQWDCLISVANWAKTAQIFKNIICSSLLTIWDRERQSSTDLYTHAEAAMTISQSIMSKIVVNSIQAAAH